MLSWIAVRAAFGEATSAVWKWLSARSLAEIACIALALFAGVQTIRLHVSVQHAAKLQTQVEKCNAARAADQTAYRQAQSDAAAKNKAQVAQIEQTYQRNSDDERQSYLSDLAKLRAQRVRAPTPAAPGSAGPASPSPSGPTAPGTDGHGLQLSPDEYLQAQEIELRLMHLQNWVETQLSVDPNK